VGGRRGGGPGTWRDGLASVAVGAARESVLAALDDGLAVAALWLGSGAVAMDCAARWRSGGAGAAQERCGGWQRNLLA
jgi:hypothetical protein